MTAVAYDSFLAEVMPACPGVPEVVAINAIRNAAVEFCTESHWLVYTPDPLNGVAGLSIYSLPCPSGTRVARVVDAYWDTMQLVAKSQEQLQGLFGIDWRTITGSPRYYTHNDDPTTITVVPQPEITEVGALTSLVALCPTRVSTTVDSAICEWWLEVIAHGAKARLMSLPGQAFTNMKYAGISEGLFRDGINKAKIERNRGLDRAVLAMRPPSVI